MPYGPTYKENYIPYEPTHKENYMPYGPTCKQQIYPLWAYSQIINILLSHEPMYVTE